MKIVSLIIIVSIVMGGGKLEAGTAQQDTELVGVTVVVNVAREPDTHTEIDESDLHEFTDAVPPLWLV